MELKWKIGLKEFQMLLLNISVSNIIQIFLNLCFYFYQVRQGREQLLESKFPSLRQKLHRMDEIVYF
jgi:hypothetical protein